MWSQPQQTLFILVDKKYAGFDSFAKPRPKYGHRMDEKMEENLINGMKLTLKYCIGSYFFNESKYFANKYEL